MRKKNTSFGVIKEGKALQASSSNKLISNISPKITGNCKIDSNGIAIGYGNFKISTIENQDNKINCFSFMFVRLSSSPKIEFGLESQSKQIIQFDFASFLYSVRSERINPQISFDGIDVSIRLYVENKTLYIYVNDVKLNYTHPVDFDSYTFFVDIKNDFNTAIILATPFHNVETQDYNSNHFLSFFPKRLNHFWCHNEKYLYSENDDYIAVARSDKNYPLISNEIPHLPGSNLIYYELIIASTIPEVRFKVGFTNHEISQSSVSSQAFDSIPYFSYPDKQLLFGSINCYTISEDVTNGTVIGLGIQRPTENDQENSDKTADKKVDENVFLIINGNEYRFTHDLLQDTNNNTKKRFNYHKHYYAFLSSSCIDFQCIFNFGQRPFKYLNYLISNYNTRLPLGWSIYSPYFPQKWCRGPPPDSHVLNMFCPPNYSKKSFFGVSYSQKVENNGCYEITVLEMENGLIEGMPTHKKGDEVMAIGFSQLDYPTDQLVGWEKNSFAIQSDDGSVFLSRGDGKNFGDHDKIKTGTNVLAQIEENHLSFFVNGTRVNVPEQIQTEIYPSISFQASPCFIVNFGDSPFNNLTDVATRNSLNESQQLGKAITKLNPNNSNSNSNDDVGDSNAAPICGDDEGCGCGCGADGDDLCQFDSVLSNNLEIHKMSMRGCGQLTVEEISYRVTLFNGTTVMMNTKDLIQFNLEVGDVIESRDRMFRGTVAGSLNNRIYVYIEKYEGAFPLVETDPLDVAIIYRILTRQNKPHHYPIIMYNTLTSVDVSKGSIADLYATDSGLSFFVGVTQRHEFVFRPLVDFYNNEVLFILTKMPESVIPKKQKPSLIPLLANSDSQSRFFISNDNLVGRLTDQETDEIEIKDQSTLKINNNLKFLDIVKILDDNYDYDKRVKQVRSTTNDNNDNNDAEDTEHENDVDAENNLRQYGDYARNSLRRLYVTNSSHSDDIDYRNQDNSDLYDETVTTNADYDDMNNSETSSSSNDETVDHNNTSNNNNDDDDDDNATVEFDDTNNLVLRNHDWSRIKNCALIVGKKGKDIVAWDGKDLIIILPTHTKLLMEPFYPFGSHRSFSNLKRVSTGLCKGGFRYPLFFSGFCGSHFIQKMHKGKRYFNSYGGCKMPPFFYHFTASLNEKKKAVGQFRRFTKINYLSLPFEFYEVDEHDESNNNDNVKVISECTFNGGCLYSPKF